MTAGLVLRNLGIYSAQFAFFVASAAILLWAFRLRAPRAQLAFWYIVLVASVLLPFVQPWYQPPIQDDGGVTAATFGFIVDGSARHGHGFSWNIGWAGTALLAVGLGVMGRLFLLALGILKLRRLRAHAQPVGKVDSIESAIRSTLIHAEFLHSDDIASPVTFGVRRPVVLVPSGFFELECTEQEAIAVHELLHVERRDWSYTVVEECVRAVLWFHPAIWFVLNRIQLAREQAVDEVVVERTNRADEYVGALLKIASARIEPDLAPAPLFLKKRHLRERVAAIVKGAHMSKGRLTLTMIAMLSVLPVVGGILAWQIPLQAAPQEVRDAPGVEVRTAANAKILHRKSVDYPSDARQKAVSGDVVVAVSVNGQGEVTDAKVVSGPEELRKPVLESVLEWHFANDSHSLPPSFEVAVRFTAPSGPSGPAGGRSYPAVALQAHPPKIVDSIDLSQLPSTLRDRVESAIPVRPGEMIGPERFAEIERTLQTIDSHLRLHGTINNDRTVLHVLLSAPVGGLGAQGSMMTSPPSRIRVGGNVQAVNLITKVTPVYPPLAKEAHVQGAVQFQAVIGKDGHVLNLQLMSGHPLLVPSATDAVKQWVYKPTLLNGEPVEVLTQIDVNYTLLP